MDMELEVCKWWRKRRCVVLGEEERKDLHAALRSGSLVAGVGRCGICFIWLALCGFRVYKWWQREERGFRSEGKDLHVALRSGSLVAGVGRCGIYYLDANYVFRSEEMFQFEYFAQKNKQYSQLSAGIAYFYCAVWTSSTYSLRSCDTILLRPLSFALYRFSSAIAIRSCGCMLLS